MSPALQPTSLYTFRLHHVSVTLNLPYRVMAESNVCKTFPRASDRRSRGTFSSVYPSLLCYNVSHSVVSTGLPKGTLSPLCIRHCSTVRYHIQLLVIIIIIINPLTARVVWAPQIFLQPVFFTLPCSPLPLGLAELQACPFLDVVFPPIFVCLPFLLPPWHGLSRW